MDSSEEFVSRSEAETVAWARTFASRLRPGDIVALNGPLGAGKTALCRGIVEGLGCAGPVHSPTYAIIHEYPGPVMVYHMDLYRLDSTAAERGHPVDWEEIGLDHYFDGSAICLVEWPDRLPAGMAIGYRVTIRVGEGNLRNIHVTSGE